MSGAAKERRQVCTSKSNVLYLFLLEEGQNGWELS